MAIKVDENARGRKIENEVLVDGKPVAMSAGIETLEDIDNSVKLQFQNNKVGSTGLEQQAAKLEKQALEHLMDKEIDEAIQTLQESERIFPQYQSVYEILRLLKQNRQELADKNSPKWKELYNGILKNFAWRLPESIKVELRNLAAE